MNIRPRRAVLKFKGKGRYAGIKPLNIIIFKMNKIDALAFLLTKFKRPGRIDRAFTV